MSVTKVGVSRYRWTFSNPIEHGGGSDETHWDGALVGAGADSPSVIISGGQVGDSFLVAEYNVDPDVGDGFSWSSGSNTARFVPGDQEIPDTFGTIT